MNSNIKRLAQKASKKSRVIIGLMSGTSLDGLDIALCKISGYGKLTKIKLLKFDTVPYTESTKKRIKEVFAKEQVNFQRLCELNAWIGNLHGELVLACLKKWKIKPAGVDIIASHGQTVFHSPKAITPGANIDSTFQAGDGDHVAVKTGIITLSDFRQKHIAAGGEGAPLAVYGDYFLFSKKGEDRIMLNIGGIANFTYLPGSTDSNKVFVTDTGPGNTLIDQAVQLHRPGVYFDKDSNIAKEGKVNAALLTALLSDKFFQLTFPKTTGPELFNMDYVRRAMEQSETTSMSLEDLLATLTRFSAETIVNAIRTIINFKKGIKIYLSGGGAHNPLLLDGIKSLLPKVDFHPMDELGISGDAKEAVLFAILANESLAGSKLNFGHRAKVPSVFMGKLSFPL
ncbi:MAG: anhydro-N-acetylmuramic acid kinase [Marivirga sp.]|nr:anhydro-N-acetylmuramic acid kinase [Marivirga sp.]